MKLRSFFLVLSAAVLALLLMGTAGAYKLLAQSPLQLLRGGTQVAPVAAMFVPKQAPIVASLLINPDRLIQLRELLVSPSERRQARSELEKLQQGIFAGIGLDYRQDLAPWIGEELTLAVTSPDLDRDPSNGKQPGYLLAIDTHNSQQGREFLERFWQKQAVAGVDLILEDYKGSQLIYRRPAPEQTQASKQRLTPLLNSPSTLQDWLALQPSRNLTTAVVGDRFVLFANHPLVLRDAINNAQAPDLNLWQLAPYQHFVQQLTRPQIGLVYANLPQLTALIGEPSPQLRERIYDTWAIALSIKSPSLLATTTLTPAPGQSLGLQSPQLGQPVAALQYVPNSSTLVAAGTQLARLWEQLQTGAIGYEAFTQILNQPLQHLQAQSGLSLPETIFSWVQGEYALALLPPLGTEPWGDWLFVAEGSPAAQAAIDQLDEAAQKQGFSVGSLTLGQQTVSVWARLAQATNRSQTQNRQAQENGITLKADVLGVHTHLGNYELFASSVEAMTAALNAPTQSIVGQSEFKSLMAPLPTPNNGSLYLNWPKSRLTLERQFPLIKFVELLGKPLFDHLQAVSFSSYGIDSNGRQGISVIQLK